jgi:hypothetical protein
VGRLPLTIDLRQRQDVGQSATFGQFLGLCGRASVRSCAFSAGTPRASRAKYATLLRRLRRHPVTVAVPGQPETTHTTYTYPGPVEFVEQHLGQVLPAGPDTGWAYLASGLESTWRAQRDAPAARDRLPPEQAAVPALTSGQLSGANRMIRAIRAASLPAGRGPGYHRIMPVITGIVGEPAGERAP